MNRLALLALTFFSVIETYLQIRNEDWRKVCARLDSQNPLAKSLTAEQRTFVFSWARRFCRIFQFNNACLVCSIVLVKLDSSPAQLFLGLHSPSAAHAWVKSSDVIYSTDRNLPKDASLVFEK